MSILISSFQMLFQAIDMYKQPVRFMVGTKTKQNKTQYIQAKGPCAGGLITLFFLILIGFLAWEKYHYIDTFYTACSFALLFGLIWYTDIWNTSALSSTGEKFKFEIKKAVDVD